MNVYKITDIITCEFLKIPKAISAFKELTEAQLITEQHCGRGMPNRYIL